jgi:drug/metabolite transporter (DMT)-like permease
MNKKLIAVYTLTLLSMLIWGVSYSWVDKALFYFNPETIASIRVFIAAPFMLILSFVLRKMQKVSRRDIFLIAAFALFDPFAYFLCESFGILHSTPVTASVIIATIPLLVPVSAFLVFKEKLTVINILGIFVSFFGVLLVIITGDLKLAVEPIGLILLFGAVFCAIIYNFFLKDLVKRYNVYTIITIQNIFASLYFLPVFLNGSVNEIAQTKINTELILIIAALSILASALAFIFYANSIKHLGITKANVFANLIPVFAAAFAYFMLKEEMGFQKVAGILLVVAGLLMTQIVYKTRKKT